MKTTTKKLFYISLGVMLIALFFLAVRSVLGLGTAAYGWLEHLRAGSFAVMTVIAELVMLAGTLLNSLVFFKIRIGADAKKREVLPTPFMGYVALGVTTLTYLCFAPHLQDRLIGTHAWNSGLPAIGIAAAAAILSIVVVRLIPARPEAE